MDIPRQLVSARTMRYRARGVPLKPFNTPLDWDDLAEFAALVDDPEDE